MACDTLNEASFVSLIVYVFCFVVFFSFQCCFFFMLMYVHQSIGGPRVGDWTHWCRTETVNATFSKRSKLWGGGWIWERIHLASSPYSSICPWTLELEWGVYLVPTRRPGHSWKRDVLVSRRTPGQIIFR